MLGKKKRFQGKTEWETIQGPARKPKQDLTSESDSDDSSSASVQKRRRHDTDSDEDSEAPDAR